MKTQRRKDISNSNMIEHQYIIKLIQKKIMHGNNKKDKNNLKE